MTTSALQSRIDMGNATGDKKYKATVERMTLEELMSITAPEVLTRGSPLSVADEVHYGNFIRALFDTKGQWEGVQVLVLWADMSPVTCSFAAKVLAEHIAHPVKGQRRKLKSVVLSGANHFVRVSDCLLTSTLMISPIAALG